MTRSCALGALTLAAVAILAACLVGGNRIEVAFAVVATAFPPLLMLVGVSGRDGRLGAAGWLVFALLLMLEGCLAGMLAFRGEVETGPWLLGLPAAAAFQIYGLFLAPQALIALGYALTFESFAVSDAELEELRQLGVQVAGEVAAANPVRAASDG